MGQLGFEPAISWLDAKFHNHKTTEPSERNKSHYLFRIRMYCNELISNST